MSRWTAVLKKIDEKVVTCLVCKGKKTNTIKINDSLLPKAEQSEQKEFVMNCFGCKGTGVMNSDQVWVHEYEQKMWCKCPPGTHKSHGSYYVDDNVHKVLRKHHYRCGKCRKVTQIG